VSNQVAGRAGLTAVLGHWQRSSSLGAGSDSGALTGELNGVARYDFGNILENFYENDIDANPYSENVIISNYYDETNFINKITSDKSSNLHFSLNVQSLNSKFSEIKNFFNELSMKKVNISTFAMQEIWQIPYPDLFNIDGFSLYTLPRTVNRGGGSVFT